MAGSSVVRSRKLHNGLVFNLRVDEIEFPSGHRSVRETAEHSRGVVIVPLFDNGGLLLVRQHRHPHHQGSSADLSHRLGSASA